jgi:hypothetical protein
MRISSSSLQRTIHTYISRTYIQPAYIYTINTTHVNNIQPTGNMNRGFFDLSLSEGFLIRTRDVATFFCLFNALSEVESSQVLFFVLFELHTSKVARPRRIREVWRTRTTTGRSSTCMFTPTCTPQRRLADLDALERAGPGEAKEFRRGRSG